MDHLVIPGLINAHGHGKGITDFQRGALDDTLETWKFRMYPPIDNFYDTLWTSIQLLESGVTTTMHNHNLSDPDDYEAEMISTVEAYQKSGIRLAFAPGISDQNIFIYGDNDAFVRSLPSELQVLCATIMDRMNKFGKKEYFHSIDFLKSRFQSDQIEILHGPMSPQWVSAEVLQEIKQHAEREGLRIHIHVQQTPLQQRYGMKVHGKSLLAYLADLGFLGKNVTCGHCVWLSEEDITLLAETGTSVTHHAACNLRVRNGISPVFKMLQNDIPVSIGMDDKEFGDKKDFIEEMRLVSKLHRLSSHRLESNHLLPIDCFRMGTEYGASVLGFSDRIGTLVPNKKADLVLLDLRPMSEPFTFPEHHIIDVLIYRGHAVDVDTVIVNGEILVKDGIPTRIDKQEILRKLKESIPADYATAFREGNGLFPALREKIAAYFDAWHEALESSTKTPYYLLNNRK